jgi:hypothetical protein
MTADWHEFIDFKYPLNKKSPPFSGKLLTGFVTNHG